MRWILYQENGENPLFSRLFRHWPLPTCEKHRLNLCTKLCINSIFRCFRSIFSKHDIKKFRTRKCGKPLWNKDKRRIYILRLLGLSGKTWTCGLYHPNWHGSVFSCALRAFIPFPLQDTCSPSFFRPLFPRVPRLSVVKTVVRPLFERIPGGALSAEKRTEFFLPHSKICKWSALWSPALQCICRQPVSNLSVTQTVVKSKPEESAFATQ